MRPLALRLAAMLVAGGVSLALAGMAAEAWLRARPAPSSRWPPERDIDPACFVPSSTRGYAPLPGACGHDADGYRTWTWPGTPPREVLLLGDSIATHRWARDTAESAARSMSPAGLRFRSAAVSGYDACQVAATWLESPSRPDLLVLQTCPNDFLTTPTVVHLPGGRVRMVTERGDVTLPAPLMHSRVLTTAASWLARPRAGIPGTSRRDAGLGCLDALRDAAAARDVPLLVLLFPQFDGQPSGADETLQRRWAADRGVDTLDLRALLGARDAALLVSPDRVHPDQPAQAAALAEILAPPLVERLD